MSKNTRTEENLLRVETIEPYLDGPEFCLRTWDTNEADAMGKYVIEYSFEQDGVEIFTGRVHLGFGVAVDSKEALESCLAFICLRPGDTDAEYFDGYNDAQTAFANEHAEAVGLHFEDDSELPSAARHMWA